MRHSEVGEFVLGFLVVACGVALAFGLQQWERPRYALACLLASAPLVIIVGLALDRPSIARGAVWAAVLAVVGVLVAVGACVVDVLQNGFH